MQPSPELRSEASLGAQVSGVQAVQAVGEPRSGARMPALDGLRGIAVLAVMAFHIGFPAFEYGWLGVDMFFVLSGYLITSLLVNERARTGTIHLGKFWGRRFLRLMPAYWLYAGGITIWALTSAPSTWHTVDGWSKGTYLSSIWLYFANYIPRKTVWDFQAITGHLWSLSLEEQFYFVWPLLVAVAFRFRAEKIVAWGGVLMLAAHGFLQQPSLFYLNGRGFGIALGCAVALSVSTGQMPKVLERASQKAVRFAWFGVSALLVLVVAHWKLTQAHSPWLARSALYAVDIAFIGVAVLLTHGPRDAFTRGASFAPLVYIGKISYGLYLYHVLARHLIWQEWFVNVPIANIPLRYAFRSGAFFALSFALAAVSYHFYEKRFLMLKERLR